MEEELRRALSRFTKATKEDVWISSNGDNAKLRVSREGDTREYLRLSNRRVRKQREGRMSSNRTPTTKILREGWIQGLAFRFARHRVFFLDRWERPWKLHERESTLIGNKHYARNRGYVFIKQNAAKIYFVFSTSAYVFI